VLELSLTSTHPVEARGGERRERREIEERGEKGEKVEIRESMLHT
jgi:hypothetical protein